MVIMVVFSHFFVFCIRFLQNSLRISDKIENNTKRLQEIVCSEDDTRAKEVPNMDDCMN